MTQAPIIDYQSHPAFARLGVQPQDDDDQISSLADAIDGHYEALLTSRLSGVERQREFDRIIAPELEKLLSLTLAHGVRDGFAPFVRAAMEDARKSLRANVTARSNAESGANSDVAALDRPLIAALDALRQEGICHFDPDDSLVRKVWNSTPVERALLRAKARANPVTRSVQPLHNGSQAWRALARHIRKSGLMGLASAYMGKPLRFAYMSLEYAHAAQSWYKNCYRDAGVETADTVYMHFDADRDLLKIILYLKDVGITNGPFRYIPGSHAWARSPLTTALQKGFDQCSVDFFETDGFDYKQGYYRPRFQEEESRKDLLSLPARLRGSTHFGDDVLNGSEEAERLLAGERPYVARAGTMILFDGSQGVHRGGQVEIGTRWVVNIGFLVNRDCAAEQDGRGLRVRLAYIKHTLGNLARLLGLR